MAASMALKMASALHGEPSDDLICAPFAGLRQRRRRLQGMLNSVTNGVRSPVNRSQDSHQGRKTAVAALAGPGPWPDLQACQCWPDVGNGALAARWQVWWQSLSGFLLSNYLLCKRFGTHCQPVPGNNFLGFAGSAWVGSLASSDSFKYALLCRDLLAVKIIRTGTEIEPFNKIIHLAFAGELAPALTMERIWHRTLEVY